MWQYVSIELKPQAKNFTAKVLKSMGRNSKASNCSESIGAQKDQPVRIYIGIGSNINTDENINKALELLSIHFKKVDVSPSYINPAQGFVGDDFVNLVAGFWYSGSIKALKKCLMDIERDCGREREKESGMNSRPIDLDLLTFGDRVGVHEGVNLPRSDVYDREFVWLPFGQLLSALSELSAPELSSFEKELLTSIQMKTKQRN